jgi:hypothetical protein
MNALLLFDFGDFCPLLIQQEAGDFYRHLYNHSRCIVLERLFLNDAQNLQSRAFGITNVSRASAAWAGNGGSLAQRRAQPLTAHFQQPEFTDGPELHTRTVLTKGIAQSVLDLTPIFRFFHVNEVNDDQAAQVP